jgi:hypothetical protein
MTTKVAPTKRTNKAKPQGRAASPARVRKLPVVKRTEEDVRRAVKQSLDLLRYRYRRGTCEQVILAWALLRMLNTMRPDIVEKYPSLVWSYIRNNPDKMFVTATAAFGFDRDVLGDEGVFAAYIGCCQDEETVKRLHKIWSPFSERVPFDLMGEAYMALLHY